MTAPRKRTPKTADGASAAEATRPDEGTAGSPRDVPVHAAWAAVMADVGAIGKDSRNQDQHFNFRGIDAVMNAVGPIMRRHGVFVLPAAVEVLESERYETRKGAVMHGMVTRHDWLIYGPRGDTMPMQTLGQAADSGDKVATKAASVAYRTSLLQSLTIPTGDPDPDAESHERTASVQDDEPRRVDPRREVWAAILNKGQGANLTRDDVAADYLARYGHAINAEQATVEELTGYLAVMLTVPPPIVADSTDALREPAAAEPLPAAEPPADPPAAGETPAAEDAAQGDTDRRNKLWEEIAALAREKGWTKRQAASDFTAWALDADGVKAALEIDGDDTTNEHLTRYYHAMRDR